MKNDAEERAVKAILHNKKPLTVVKNLQKDENYKSAMVAMVQKIMNKETTILVSKKSDIFRNNNCNSNEHYAMDFSWETMNEGAKKCAPVVYSSLCGILNEQNKNIPIMMTALAILLYGRSRVVNKIQCILGLVLDKSGLTKEVIANINQFAMSSGLNEKVFLCVH